jgi:CRP-like cAMP-binding protein
MAKDTPPANRNLILARLSESDFGLLAPHLETVELPVRMPLEKRNQSIKHAYFIGQGFASVVAHSSGLGSIEIGLVGREGVTGLAVIMGAGRTPHETYMQYPGAGQRIPSAKLRTAMEQSIGLHQVLLAYAHTFLVQTGYTALSNGRSTLEERLARWLLMAHDRVGSDELALTHEFLAIMLGVRRPGVTLALSLLERKGLIEANRGLISIVDRQGLEETSKGAYGAPEAESRRLFG